MRNSCVFSGCCPPHQNVFQSEKAVPERSALLSVGVVHPLGEVVPQGKAWNLHAVWHKLCGNGEGVAWCSISPDVGGHPLSQPLLSLVQAGWPEPLLNARRCYNQQPTTASLRNSPVGSSPSSSHGYFPGRKASQAQVPVAAGESPRQECAAGCGEAGLEQSGKRGVGLYGLEGLFQPCDSVKVKPCKGQGFRAEGLWIAALAGSSWRGRTGTGGRAG